MRVDTRGAEVMKLIKLLLVGLSVLAVFFGIVYRVVVLPFSSPTFALVSWICIGAGALVLAYVGRRK